MVSISKHFLSFLFVIIFSLLGLSGFAQGRKLSDIILDEESSGGGSDLQCVSKLLPCNPYLKAPENVPKTCCVPLKQMVIDDTKCLCTLLNQSATLKRFDITQDDALKLSKACGANADISICKNDASSPSSSPATPPASCNNSSSSSNSPGSSKSAAYTPSSRFGGSGFAAIFMALVITAF